ncbi:hypothetical protein [Microbulbifer celer]|uniref:DUF885 domain-containing protein n=1 Tax=Microbulbifer celer TaxID=435905 RepID=A0ABW3UDZ7_9GAMM|nr:hypothetical protein [Microbulbifer celer]UFN55901.1 hypothetical protein LPW13_09935 [Microbulbifer celer]
MNKRNVSAEKSNGRFTLLGLLLAALLITACGKSGEQQDSSADTTSEGDAVATARQAGEGAEAKNGEPDTDQASDPGSILDSIAEQYVQLVLALGNHDKSYVDAYYGPADWKASAEQDPASAAELANRAEQLLAQLPETVEPGDDLETLRIHYLKTQLRAVAYHAHHLGDAGFRDFDREAKALYDTEPPVQTFDEFEPVLAQLEQELPGEDPLYLRVKAFQDQFVIPEDKMPAVFDAAIEACRERTKQHVDLPQAESFKLEYVQDKPWSGYNWYQGNAHSLIQINTELPVHIDRAIDLGCHEGYPGHHTYNALLEQTLVEDKGWREYSVYPLFSPQSLIAEGSANYGIELAFPGGEKAEFEKETLYPLAGLNPARAEKYDRVLALKEKLSFAENIVARQYINGKIDRDRAVELFQQYAVMSPEKARQQVRFVDTYGAYVINYNWGKQLVKNYVEEGAQSQDARWQRFAKLLSSPRLPSSLNW